MLTWWPGDDQVILSKKVTWARSYEGEVLVLSEAVGVFVLLEQVSQTLQVKLVKTVDVLAAGTGGLDHQDRLSHWERTQHGVRPEPVGRQIWY